MNSTIVLMIIVGAGAIVLAVLALKFSKPEDEKVKSNTPKRPKKSVKLYTHDGVLLHEYKDVYLTHWDENIYFLSYEYEGKSFLRIDKGTDMLLLVESYLDNENSK